MRLLSTFRKRLTSGGNGTGDDRVAAMEHQCQEILEQLKTLNERVSRLAQSDAQLRAIFERDADLEPHQARLQEVLGKANISTHIARAIGRSELRNDPFPHAIIDDVLPDDLYGCLIKGLPPVELFGDRPVNKQYLTVPFAVAPAYSQRVWRFMSSVVVPDFIVPAVVEKFREPVGAWISRNWPDVTPDTVTLHNSDGRILLRRRGYRIPPHRDPKWGFVTCILYLARRHDSEAWGTQLFTVDDDEEARGASPHWINAERCHHVGDVAFRANRMLVLLNSVGAHGASIPDDAQPENLERYIYQFRIAPTVESMSMLKATLPEERRPFWAGKGGDY
jgi:hypothetical protein